MLCMHEVRFTAYSRLLSINMGWSLLPALLMLPTHRPACLPAYLPVYLPACLPAYLPACLPAYLPACLPLSFNMTLKTLSPGPWACRSAAPPKKLSPGPWAAGAQPPPKN